MAQAAGIEMHDCRLFEEGDRAHFMTKRFDRTSTGSKLHMQSLGAMMHFDFNSPGAYSYEQAIQVIRKLELSTSDVEQQARRAIFNVIARNQDDHVKNIAFLMNREGRWRLSPAYDVAYSYNPSGDWTSQHQMSLAGKRDNFEPVDLINFAGTAGIKRAKAKAMVAEISQAVDDWKKHSAAANVGRTDQTRIATTHRRDLFV